MPEKLENISLYLYIFRCMYSKNLFFIEHMGEIDEENPEYIAYEVLFISKIQFMFFFIFLL